MEDEAKKRFNKYYTVFENKSTLFSAHKVAQAFKYGIGIEKNFLLAQEFERKYIRLKAYANAKINGLLGEDAKAYVKSYVVIKKIIDKLCELTILGDEKSSNHIQLAIKDQLKNPEKNKVQILDLIREFSKKNRDNAGIYKLLRLIPTECSEKKEELAFSRKAF